MDSFLSVVLYTLYLLVIVSNPISNTGVLVLFSGVFSPGLFDPESVFPESPISESPPPILGSSGID